MAPKNIAINTNAIQVSPIPIRSGDFVVKDTTSNNTKKNKNGSSKNTVVANTTSSSNNEGNANGKDDSSNGHGDDTKAVVSGKFSFRNHQAPSSTAMSTWQSKPKSNEGNHAQAADTSSLELKELQSIYEERKLEMERMNKERTKNMMNTTDVQRTIEAIHYEMNKAKDRYDEIQQQISDDEEDDDDDEEEEDDKNDEEQKEEEEVDDKFESGDEEEQQHQLTRSTQINELEHIIQSQEQQIQNIVDKIQDFKQDTTTNDDGINTTNAINEKEEEDRATEEGGPAVNTVAAKYAELRELEDKLNNLRDEQNNAREIQAGINESYLRGRREEQQQQQLQQQEASSKPMKTDDNVNTTNATSNNSSMKKEKRSMTSQPWIPDHDWKKDLLNEPSVEQMNELEIGANDNDTKSVTVENPDNSNEEHHPPSTNPPRTTATSENDNDSLSLPTLIPPKERNPVVKSARKKRRSSFVAAVATFSGSSSSSSISDNSQQSLNAIFDEHDEDAKKSNGDPRRRRRRKKENGNDSDTSVTVEEGSSNSSISASPLACAMSTDEDSTTCETNTHGSAINDSVSDELHQEQQRLVEIMQTEDGGIEAESIPSLSDTVQTGTTSDTHDDDNHAEGVLSSTSTEWSTDENESSVDYTSGESSTNCESSSGESSTNCESSNGEYYTSGESTQSSCPSVLEKIIEGDETGVDNDDTEDELEWDVSSIVENITAAVAETTQSPKNVGANADNVSNNNGNTKYKKHVQILQDDNFRLLKQLKDSQAKYAALMEGYNGLITTTQKRGKLLHDQNEGLQSGQKHQRVKELEGQNKKLRANHNLALDNMAQQSEATSRSEQLKEENKMLLKNIEKNNTVMLKASKKYEHLQMVHKETLNELKEKNSRYDQLILDFSNVAEKSKGDGANYCRLEALHEAVVMKLGDISEENEKLQQERDDARKELNNTNQNDAYNEAIRDLNETQSAHKALQEEHEHTLTELKKTREHNSQPKQINESEASTAVESKLNTSKARVSMLEDKLKESREGCEEEKKKHAEREDQLRDVIMQYKKLKQEHEDKCATLDRLKNACDNEEKIKQMTKLEEKLVTAKKNAEDAANSKDARENDLRIVLKHYEALQKKHESTIQKFHDVSQKYKQSMKQVKLLEHRFKGPSTGVSKEGGGNYADDSKREIEKLTKEMQLKLNEYEKSSKRKDAKIVTTLTDLKTWKEQVVKLRHEKMTLQDNLSTLKSQLLVARRDSSHKLQQEHTELQGQYKDVQMELENMEKVSNVHRDEEKRARKRAALIHAQYKKLQHDHDIVVQRLERLKAEMTIFRDALQPTNSAE